MNRFKIIVNELKAKYCIQSSECLHTDHQTSSYDAVFEISFENSQIFGLTGFKVSQTITGQTKPFFPPFRIFVFENINPHEILARQFV